MPSVYVITFTKVYMISTPGCKEMVCVAPRILPGRPFVPLGMFATMYTILTLVFKRIIHVVPHVSPGGPSVPLSMFDTIYTIPTDVVSIKTQLYVFWF